MKKNYQAVEEIIVQEIQDTMRAIDDTQVQELIMKIKEAHRVFFIGVGRVLLSLEAIAKRLAHLGIDTVVVGQITEPAITPNDLLIVGSGSGESAIPLAIAKKGKQVGAAVAHIGSNAESTMHQYSDIFVRIPVQTKLALPSEIISKQPMTSLFEQCLLLLGDSIALMLVKEQDIDMKKLWRHHANLE